MHQRPRRWRASVETLEPRRVLDSTVVFNELMYNPVGAESREWVELHNQMSVDVDLSNWKIQGGVEYEFPSGIILRGGEYLVVAANPSFVAAEYGLDTVLGPFSGRLSNGGERIELRNHTDRLMNTLVYDDDGNVADPWPVAADGTDATLAKIDPQAASEIAENWSFSRSLGGTPGQQNFPRVGDVDRTVLVAMDAHWRFDQSGVDRGTEWRQPDFDDDDWPSGRGVLARETADLSAPKNTSLELGLTTYYFRTTFDFRGDPAESVLRLQHLVDDGAVFYLNGQEFDRYRMPDGEIQSSTLADSTTPDATPVVGKPINPTLLRQGVNTLAVEVHQSSRRSNDVVFGVEVWQDQRVKLSKTDVDNVQITEVASAGGPFWVELTNHGDTSVSLDRWVLADTAGHRFEVPSYDLAAGSTWVMTESAIGFGVDAEERVFLVSGDEIVDAVRVTDHVRGRAPQLDGRWQRVAHATPGKPNLFELHDQIVINEILYHARPTYPAIYTDPPTEFSANDEEWIELYNRGQTSVDISGWQLVDAVQFRVPAGNVLQPGEHVIIARDAAMFADNYPEVRVLGEYRGQLSNVDERIVLVDEVENVADEVHYFEGGYWSGAADGGGSTLELIDSAADNRHAGAWGKSDETARSTWQHVSYSSTIEPGFGSGGGDFVMGLLDAGELLIDNVSVKEVRSDGTKRELIRNGDFDGDVIGQQPNEWRIGGTHRESVVVPDARSADNHVLRLVATGRMHYLVNHAATTFVDGVSAQLGKTYEISYDAKWISGSPQLLTEFRYMEAARTTILDQPQEVGTPGKRNSLSSTDLGPTYLSLRHQPVVPNEFQPVTIFVTADDPHGIAEMRTLYRVDGEAGFESALMTSAGDGSYVVTIPPQPEGTLVQFYVEGVDTQGATSVYPPDGPRSRALYRVDNTFNRDPHRQTIQMLMTAEDTSQLRDLENAMENHHRGTTLIVDGQRAFYDVGTRLRGSSVSRPRRDDKGYSIRFRPDELFRGVHDSIVMDQLSEQEMIVKFIINQSGNFGGSYDDVVQLLTPSGIGGGPTLTLLARQTDIYWEEQFGDNAGTVFKQHGFARDIEDLGGDKEVYRWAYLINGNRSQDDYSGIIAMAKAFDAPDEELEQAVAQLLDMETWSRTFALLSLFGVSDTYSQGGPHNLNFYVPPSGTGIMAIPWDWDSAYGVDVNAPLFGREDRKVKLARIFDLPIYNRMLMGHMDDLINTVVNPEYMERWVDHFAFMLNMELRSMQLNADRRGSFVRSQFPRRVPFAAGVSKLTVVDQRVVSAETPAEILIPSRRNGGNRLGDTWTQPEFVASKDWVSGYAGVGFERASSDLFEPYIQTTIDAMLRNNASVFVRISFDLDEVPDDNALISLGMRYDDGFVASLNGTPVAMSNAPPSVRWDSDADGSRHNDDAVQVEQFDISEYRHLLVEGKNVLSIHGLNSSVNSSDALFSPELVIGDFVFDSQFDGAWTTDDASIDVEGVAWIDVHELRRKGDTDPLPLDWDEVTEWSTSIALEPGENVIELEAYNYQGDLIGTSVLSVYSTVEDPATESLRISELMYHPHQPNRAERQAGFTDDRDFEFLELVNIHREAAVSLNGLAITGGISFSFPDIELAAGERVVVASNPTAFQLRYGNVQPVLGPFRGSLSNAGERVVLENVFGAELVVVDYADAGLWPRRADGVGASLVARNLNSPAGTYEQDDQWRASTQFGGSPGNGESPHLGVLINEVLTRPDVDGRDSIELYNQTSQSIDVSGWYLSDNENELLKFEIPAGTVIKPMQYHVFDEKQFNPTPSSPLPNHFALSGLNGESVWLVRSDGQDGIAAFGDDVHFAASRQGESLVRLEMEQSQLVPSIVPTLGRPNGPVRPPTVVISEILFKPSPPSIDVIEIDPTITVDQLEYLELTNRTNSSVDLTEWRLRGGIEMDFAEGLVLDAGEPLLVTSFDPEQAANATLLAAFLEAYGLSSTARIVGGYRGSLHDRVEEIHLLSAEVTDDDVVRPLEEQVVYRDQDPWPEHEAGWALERSDAAVWGTLAAAWHTARPNPGTPPQIRGDLTADLTINVEDIDRFCGHLRSNDLPLAFDLDGDRAVGDDDLRVLVEDILGSVPGDADLNGRFDSEDFVTVFTAGQFNLDTPTASWATGDWNCDGVFDHEDLIVAAPYYS